MLCDGSGGMYFKDNIFNITFEQALQIEMTLYYIGMTLDVLYDLMHKVNVGLLSSVISMRGTDDDLIYS